MTAASDRSGENSMSITSASKPVKVDLAPTGPVEVQRHEGAPFRTTRSSQCSSSTLSAIRPSGASTASRTTLRPTRYAATCSTLVEVDDPGVLVRRRRRQRSSRPGASDICCTPTSSLMRVTLTIRGLRPMTSRSARARRRRVPEADRLDRQQQRAFVRRLRAGERGDATRVLDDRLLVRRRRPGRRRRCRRRARQRRATQSRRRASAGAGRSAAPAAADAASRRGRPLRAAMEASRNAASTAASTGGADSRHCAVAAQPSPR